MKSSAILSVILIFVSIDCNSIDYKTNVWYIETERHFQRQSKPTKSMENTLQMYGKGKEWQFVATNEMIYLLPENADKDHAQKNPRSWPMETKL